MVGGGGWDDATLAGLPLERGAKAAGLPDWPVDADADGSAFESRVEGLRAVAGDREVCGFQIPDSTLADDWAGGRRGAGTTGDGLGISAAGAEKAVKSGAGVFFG